MSSRLVFAASSRQHAGVHQRSLFPDGFELIEAALAHFRALRVPQALATVQRARTVDASMPGLTALQRALEWSMPRLGPATDVDAVAAALVAVGASVAAGELDGDAAARVEAGLGAFLATILPTVPTFVDEERTLSGARLLLLRGDTEAARLAAMSALGDGHGDDAGLWFDYADACAAVGRPHDANTSYVRGLLLGPRRGHGHRVRAEPLAALWRRGVARAGPLAAADALLVDAWIEGVLSIKAGNRWLSPEQRALARDRSEEFPAWRFALLVYLDRSAPVGGCDMEAREEMAMVMPDVFARFLAEVQRRQG